MSTSQAKTVDAFVQLQNRNALSQAIRAAVNLGILKSLAAGQKTVQQLADELALQPAPLQRLLNVLEQTGLIERYDNDFALSTIARLIPEPYLDFGDRYWEHLSEHVRTGSALPTSSPQSLTTEALPATSRIQAELPRDQEYLNQKATEDWMLTPVAIDAAQVLDIGKSRRGLRILEIGAGSAVFSATMAHRDPDSVINLLDTAAGLERSRKTIASVGLEQQTEWITTEDIFDLPTVAELAGQTFDLVVLAGIIHRLNSVECSNLFNQLQQFVKSNCELVIIDVFRGQKQGDAQLAILELELGLRTQAGQLHEPGELKTMLQAAGFGNLQFAHLPATPHYWGLLVGSRLR